MKVLLSLLAFLFSISVITAQELDRMQEYIDAIYTNSEETLDEATIAQYEEDLYAVFENKIDLNNSTKEQLEQLHFLSETQIENIHYHIYTYGPLQTIYELQLIKGLYKQDILNLLPFITLSNSAKEEKVPLTWKNIWETNKQEWILRTDICPETKKGYKSTENEGYLGNKLYTSIRYKFKHKDRFYFGFSAEKDAGEQFWGSKNKGFDFYSFHCQINNIGKIKNLVIGDFRASFGQGLIVNSNFGFGKGAMTCNTSTNTNNNLQRYTSLGEYNFFRGIGTTFNIGKIELSSFYSIRLLDGKVTNETFTSFKTDGLHRTISEHDNKNTITTQTAAIHASLKQKRYKIGATFLATWFNKNLQPEPQPYNYFYLSGKYQHAASIDYQTKWKNIYFFGEWAINQKQALATINTIKFSPSPMLNMAVLHRYYSEKYDAIYANSFYEGSRISNEEGLYIGLELYPIPKWKFSAYADTYTFPWLCFSVDKPSNGYDILTQADFTPNQYVSMYCRFKIEQKENNISSDNNIITTITGIYDKRSIRYRLKYLLNKNISLTTSIETNYAKYENNTASYGFLLMQDVSYTLSKLPIKINARYEIFDATHYENRFYYYENDVLYTFSSTMLYGKGSRWYINLKYKIIDNLSIYLKFAQTIYSDKSSISSGLEEIKGNKKTDIRLLLKLNVNTTNKYKK